MSGKPLRLVIVTPERTLLDEVVAALRFPLFDGEFGVLPGRAPVIGRLGTGELKITTSEKVSSFFIDGGFLQIQGEVVTLLTQRALPVEQIQAAEAQKELQAAEARVAKTEADFDTKTRDISRARKLLKLAHASPGK